MDHNPETIAKFRRLQVGLFLLHFALIIVAATHFTVEGEPFFGLITAFTIAMALWELFGSNSLLRTTVDELQVRSIADRPLRWYEWFIIVPVGALTIAQLLAVTILDPSEMNSTVAILPVLFTALFVPVVLIFFTFDRSIFSIVTTALTVGFRPPPPGSESWDDLRSDAPEKQELALVAVLFWVCLDLQLLLLTIWADSMSFLLL